MKYKKGDVIITIDQMFIEKSQMDIEQYLYKEFYMNKVGIILKVNKAEQLYTILFAGDQKNSYIKEYMIKQKLE